jgi:hypothetical protein
MATPNDPIEGLIKAINANVGKGYVQKRIPCAMDDMVSSLIKLFINETDLGKSHICEMVNWDLSSILICYAERMASLGVREKSRDRLVEGLVALVIENHFGDWRDNLTVLSPLYDAAKKIGSNPDELFLEVASLYKNNVATSIEQFTKRPLESRSLAAFNYSESSDADGFRYKGFELDKDLFRKIGIELD